MSDELNAAIEKQTEALSAAMAKVANGKQPWWVDFIKFIGIPGALLFAIAGFGWIYGGQYLDKSMKLDEQRQAELSTYLKSQTTATETLIDRANKEREFEATVHKCHENQTQTLVEIRDILEDARAVMAPVPELRQQELNLLRDIKTELEKE